MPVDDGFKGGAGTDRVGVNVPVPDPSLLTTQQLREGLDGLEKLLGVQLNAMNEATHLRLQAFANVPAQINERVGDLQGLHDEKFRSQGVQVEERFSSVALQFEERDKRGERESRDNKVAVDAAFAAQKEAACLSVDSKILCSDLIWRRAGDLLPGDELIAFDEDSPTDISSGRRYRRSIVTANTIAQSPLVRVVTPVGDVLCTPEHPWLLRRYAGRAYEWRRADALQPGDQVIHMLDPWEVDRSYEAGWLAGILDGEGCLTFKSRRNGGGKVSIGQVAGVTADAIDLALKEHDLTVVAHVRSARGRAQAQRRWEINGRADVLRLLGTVRPMRLMAQADRVWEGFAIRGQHRLVSITSVEDGGRGSIARLSTSTHTYIGDGFAMHNSEQNKSNTLAISKSEAATAETINKLEQLVSANIQGLNDKVDDIKATASTLRLEITASINLVRQELVAYSARVDGSAAGGRSAIVDSRQVRNEGRLDAQVLASLLGVLLLVVSVSVAIYVAAHK